MKNPAIITKHIEDFMQSHPHLVENPGLESEVLFELEGDFKKVDKTDEYIHFLIKIRNEFPSTYKKSAGYYDKSIIAWLIANNRQADIALYLEYFFKYPVDFANQLFELVDLLLATDNISPLISLASATLYNLTQSTKIYGGDRIAYPLIWQTMTKYLQQDFSKKNIADFMNELKIVLDPIEVEINKESLSYWELKFTDILKPFTRWPDSIPKKQSQMKNKYEDISNNFGYFLYKSSCISWPAACYYAGIMLSYFLTYTDMSTLKIKVLFDLSEDKIDEIVGSISKKFIWMDSIKVFSLLQAIFIFAAYLKKCGNVDEKEMLSIQNSCCKLYKEVYPLQKAEFVETDRFKEFPFLKLNN